MDGFVATKNETYNVFGFAPYAKDSTDAKDAKDVKEQTRRFLGDDTFRNHFYSWYHASSVLGRTYFAFRITRVHHPNPDKHCPICGENVAELLCDGIWFLCRC